ncbi:MAG TPA: hypothetical protein VM901_13050 [Bdellovibrionota bacterium]|nr:hypothetical protein [Bdellovibrionota bacterium]
MKMRFAALSLILLIRTAGAVPVKIVRVWELTDTVPALLKTPHFLMDPREPRSANDTAYGSTSDIVLLEVAPLAQPADTGRFNENHSAAGFYWGLKSERAFYRLPTFNRQPPSGLDDEFEHRAFHIRHRRGPFDRWSLITAHQFFPTPHFVRAVGHDVASEVKFSCERGSFCFREISPDIGAQDSTFRFELIEQRQTYGQRVASEFLRDPDSEIRFIVERNLYPNGEQISVYKYDPVLQKGSPLAVTKIDSEKRRRLVEGETALIGNTHTRFERYHLKSGETLEISEISDRHLWRTVEKAQVALQRLSEAEWSDEAKFLKTRGLDFEARYQTITSPTCAKFLAAISETRF